MNARLFLTGSIAVTSLLEINAADFINLGFDEANLSRLETTNYHSLVVKYGSVSDMLPGWTVLQDGGEYKAGVFFGNTPDNAIGMYQGIAGGLIQDKYLEYELKVPGQTDYIPKLQLIQVGMIPVDAWELRTYGFPPLFINGEQMEGRELPTFRSYAYDVRQFAGKEVTLEIRNFLGEQRGGLHFDIYGFQTPEPSEWALLATGGAMLFWWKWRSNHSRSPTNQGSEQR